METNIHTEEEFKKILKILFAEKKKTNELQKSLDKKSLQKKIQLKFVGRRREGLFQEINRLKAELIEKERDNLRLKEQLEKVRPALKRLVDDLKGARSELELLKKERALQPQSVGPGESHEALLERAYFKMKELVSRHSEDVWQKEALLKKNESQELQLANLQSALKNGQKLREAREAEIKRAHHYLAKKVKEATILRDLVERQKMQLIAMQTANENLQEKYLSLQQDGLEIRSKKTTTA